MKRIIVALVAVAVACSSEKERPIQYGAPAAPAYDEQAAAASAQTTLQGSLAFAPSTEPSAGAAGLADQLVAALDSGYTVGKTLPSEESRKLAATATTRVIATGGIDPACVSVVETLTQTTVTWTGCTDTVTTTGPGPGDSSTMTVTVDGTLTWTPGTGVTAWDIHESMAAMETQGGTTVTLNMTAELDGSIAVTGSTIVGSSASSVHVTENYAGLRMSAGVRTTLALDLGYEAVPFCVTSGTLVLEQRWTERPMGATEANLPDQGWRFEWAGCDAFTVAHGS